MIYRIFLELFKSKSPSSKRSQDHETEHRSVFSISVKDPYPNPPIRECSIPCPRLPLENLKLHQTFRIPSCNFYHLFFSSFFISRNQLPLFQTRFVPLSFCLYHSCASESLVPSRHYFFHVVAILLIWVWKLVWNLNYILILLPLPLFCSDVNYVWLSLINELFYDMLISSLPFSTTRFRSWYESESHPALNPLPFFADYGRPSDEAITLYRNLISFLRCLGLNSVSITVFSCILYIVKINVIHARSTV